MEELGRKVGAQREPKECDNRKSLESNDVSQTSLYRNVSSQLRNSHIWLFKSWCGNIQPVFDGGGEL